MSSYCRLSDIAAFTTACDNMVASKYILVDKRLGDVLKSIASTKPIFNLISECMVNFNFEKELNVATSKLGKFVIPEEPHKCIAFIFCLLNLLDDKKINFNQFLNKYFSNDEEGIGPYATFCNNVILLFKNVIVATLVGFSETETNQCNKKQLFDFSPELLDRLLFLVKDFKAFVHGMKVIRKSKCTRSELLEQINSLILAIDERQVQYLRALILGVKYSIGSEKELARRLIEIEDIIEKVLDQKISEENS